MQYAILCYHHEKVVTSWTKEEDDAVMARINVVQDRLRKEGHLGPSARLQATSTATTLRKDSEPPVIMDGPFAETKEQLLGFYLIEVADKEEAIRIARDLASANPGGAYEIRPLFLYHSGDAR